MKKACSVRGVINQEIGDFRGGYKIAIEDRDGSINYINVPKSAVTDIREEVDWSKVKKGTPVYFDQQLWWVGNIKTDGDPIRIPLFRRRYRALNDLTSEGAHYTVAPEEDIALLSDCLTDWLKKEGGKNGTR